jgi:hypothetical protein
MKDKDNNTNALCYCKDSLPLKRLSSKEESKGTVKDTLTNGMNHDKSKPWSVFGEWYWI